MCTFFYFLSKFTTSKSDDLLTLRIAEITTTFSKEIASLRQEISFLRFDPRRDKSCSRRTPHRSHSRGRSQSRSSDTCWYHWSFGPSAKKCEQPCKFNQGNDGVK
uniref:Uncharacterized protein n=1 Tax=Cacopsylla melanoneura TaxID=428564 RepID=A0A8D8TJW9_9HEMI